MVICEKFKIALKLGAKTKPSQNKNGNVCYYYSQLMR